MTNITVKHATENDSLDLFKWRNDPVTREMFFTQNELSLDAHTKWFRSSLINPARIILIGYKNSQKIGVVRFDINDDNVTANISINLNPDYRGQNLAHKLLLCAQNNIPLRIKSLRAEIKNKNTASIKTFQRAGYSFKTEDNTNVTYKKALGTKE